MSQADIDVFAQSAYDGTLTPEGVTAAVATRGIPVNGRRSGDGCTALDYAVYMKHRELVVALLEAGADANAKDNDGWTSVWQGASSSTADILQLLIDGGGSVNEPSNDGCTPLIRLVRYNEGDAAARLGVLLARPELDVDTTYRGRTAEEWAVEWGHLELAAAIVVEVGCTGFAELRLAAGVAPAYWFCACSFSALDHCPTIPCLPMLFPNLLPVFRRLLQCSHHHQPFTSY